MGKPARTIQAFFLDLSELNLIAVHLTQKKKQPPYLRALLEPEKSYREENSLIIGGFNCNIPFEAPETRPFEYSYYRMTG